MRYDDSIKDHPAKFKDPTPFLSRARKTNMMRSQSENGWWSDGGNGKKTVELTGWKFHHTYGPAAWIRNAEVVVKNAQFSDAAESIVFPSVEAWGARKTLKNSLIVGFSKNTGPFSCDVPSNLRPWKSFTEVLDCPAEEGSIKVFTEAPVPVPSIQRYHWWKADGDVYRQVPFPKRFPQQGVSLFNTWMPTDYFNIT